MLRKVLAIVGGTFLGMLTTSYLKSYSFRVHPGPEEKDQLTPEAFEAFVAGLPDKVFYIIIASHVIGALMAGLVAAKISPDTKFWVGMIAVFLIFIFSISTFLAIPHPTWVMTMDLPSILVGGMIGSALGSKL